ncbi:NosD domain-containing protein [Psychrobacter sp. CAL346-MNA-CIBAN-0220]|uniref:NosD domain-containing protein n=1 Tax=Psychrobacter sp. CAL346-MNA-CIBAN-0220 TaxID=3140457 RepID=UPI00331AC733
MPYANADRVDSNANSNSQTDNDNAIPKHSRVIDATLPTPTTTINCTTLTPNQTIKIKGNSVLSQGCDLTDKSVRFVLDSSHSSLDCQGAALSTMADDQSNASAITIEPKTDKAIRDIAVANCHVNGYGHALHIRQYSNPNQRYARGLTDPKANRALAPRDIHIINISSINSNNSGIFVGDHVQAVTFDRVRVQNAGTVGLYLEFGSRDNVIKNSVFVGNGFRTFKPNREAIAVDSSANNRIENNQFIHNGAGSILLYRNCFEHANDSSRSNHFKRTESSRDNIIRNNVFRDEPVGVWVASRQSRNLKGFECGAYLIKQTLFVSYHLDSAKDNIISNNRFEQVKQGIIIEDDGTRINGNQFAASVDMPISVGSEIREESAVGAVKDTVINDNTFIDKTLDQAINIRTASKTATKIWQP